MAELDQLGIGDDEDEIRQRYAANPSIARPNPQAATPPLTLRGVGASTTPTSPAPLSPALKAQTDADMAQQSQLAKGSGISQVAKAHPIGGGILRGLNMVGTIAGAVDPLARSITTAIPGTEEHHNKLLGQNRGAIAQDTAEAEKEAQTSNIAATPELKQEAIDAKAQAAQAEGQRKTEHDQGQLAEQYRKLGLKIDPTTKQPVAISYEEMTPQEQGVHDLKEAQTEAAEARAELDKMRGDPNSPTYQMQMKRLQIAQKNAQNAATRLQLSTAEFSNKLNEQELVKPSGQSQSRGSAAQAALNVLPHLQELVNKNGSQMGVVMGRINRGEIALGDVSPDVAELYGAMKSFYALQPAIHGFRNAEFVKDFESAIGTLERDPKAFLAGMQGLKPTMESVANEGKTSHKRIVEGRDTPTAQQNTSAPQPPKAPDPGMKWQSRTTNGKTEWRQVPQ